MANYANLLATIAANIYQNGNNEVTAPMVKTAVDAMVASLGAGYQFIGVATPATNPGTPDYKCFYIASTPGTYANFPDSGNNPIEINDGLYVLAWDTEWKATQVSGAVIDKQILQMRITEGKVFNVYTKQEVSLSTGVYGRIELSGEKVVFVTGVQHGSNNYPFISFWTSGDTLISVYGQASTAYTEAQVDVPGNAAYALLQASTAYPYGCYAESFTAPNSGKIFYRVSDDRIDVTSRYGTGLDLKMALYRKSYNMFFDFAEAFMIANTDSRPSQLYGGEKLWGTAGDWHGPIKVLAVNNRDGDKIYSHDWTGGAHPYDNSLGGTPTMRCVGLRFFVDGQEVVAAHAEDNYIDGYLYNVNTNAVSSYANGTYQRIDIPAGATALSLTGSTQGSLNFPLVAFYDSGDNLLGTYGAVNTSYTGEVVNIPAGSAYAITNAQLAAPHEAKVIYAFYKSGYCDHVEIRWTNFVQSYATAKVDGTGREVMQENHILQFDGCEWKSYVEIIALEDIVIEKWNGFQYTCFAADGIYPKVRFLNAVNREEGVVLDAANISDDKACSLIRGYGTTHQIEMHLDTSFDIGKREHYEGTWGANTQTFGKGYFYVIGLNANEYADFAVDAGQLIALRGKYIFSKIQ